MAHVVTKITQLIKDAFPVKARKCPPKAIFMFGNHVAVKFCELYIEACALGDICSVEVSNGIDLISVNNFESLSSIIRQMLLAKKAISLPC